MHYQSLSIAERGNEEFMSLLNEGYDESQAHEILMAQADEEWKQLHPGIDLRCITGGVL